MKLNIIEWRDVYGETYREAILGPRELALEIIQGRQNYLCVISLRTIAIDNLAIIR